MGPIPLQAREPRSVYRRPYILRSEAPMATNSIKLESLRSAIQQGQASGPAQPVEAGELVKRVKAQGRRRLKTGKHAS